MADTIMQGIRNQLADALDKPALFSGDSWGAAQQMIGTLAGVSLDGLSPEQAASEYPWLGKFLRSGEQFHDPHSESPAETAAREQAAQAREERLAPLHDLNDQRSRLAYQVAAERGHDPGDWAALATVYDDPRFAALDEQIAQVKAQVLPGS